MVVLLYVCDAKLDNGLLSEILCVDTWMLSLEFLIFDSAMVKLVV